MRNLYERHRTEILAAIINEYTDWENPSVSGFEGLVTVFSGTCEDASKWRSRRAERRFVRGAIDGNGETPRPRGTGCQHFHVMFKVSEKHFSGSSLHTKRDRG